MKQTLLPLMATAAAAVNWRLTDVPNPVVNCLDSPAFEYDCEALKMVWNAQVISYSPFPLANGPGTGIGPNQGSPGPGGGDGSGNPGSGDNMVPVPGAGPGPNEGDAKGPGGGDQEGNAGMGENLPGNGGGGQEGLMPPGPGGGDATGTPGSGANIVPTPGVGAGPSHGHAQGPGGGDESGIPGSGDNLPGNGEGPNEGDNTGPGGGDDTGTPGSGEHVRPTPGAGPGPDLGDAQGPGGGDQSGQPGVGDNLPGNGQGGQEGLAPPGPGGGDQSGTPGSGTNVRPTPGVGPGPSLGHADGPGGGDQAGSPGMGDNLPGNGDGPNEGAPGPGGGTGTGTPGSGQNGPGGGAGPNLGDASGPGGGVQDGNAGQGDNLPGNGPGPNLGDVQGPGGGDQGGVPGTGGTRLPRLLLYLPGTRGMPDQARDGFLTSIAHLGHVHVLSLPYVSTPFQVQVMNQICGGQSALANYTATVDECVDNHHRVMLYGASGSGSGAGPNMGTANGPGTGMHDGVGGSGANLPGNGAGPNTGDAMGPGGGDQSGNAGMGDNLPGNGDGPNAGSPGPGGGDGTGTPGSGSNVMPTPGIGDGPNRGDAAGPGGGDATGTPGTGVNLPGNGDGPNQGDNTGPGGGDDTGTPGSGENVRPTPGAGPGPDLGDAQGPGGGNQEGTAGSGENLPGNGAGPNQGSPGPGGGDGTGTPGSGANINPRRFWPFWNVQPEHSVRARLYDTLANLHATAPTEGWNLFFDAQMNTVNWDRIITSGFSQGAGHAAFLAYEQRVARGVFLSGPEDCCSFTSFMSRPWQTPNDRLTAWYHNEDDLRGVIEDNLKQRQMSNKALFVPGALSASPELDGLHLYTRDQPADTCGGGNREFHLTSTFDRCAPRSDLHDSGFQYEPVWQVMATGAFANDAPSPVVLTDAELLEQEQTRATHMLYALIATGAALGCSLGFIGYKQSNSQPNGRTGTIRYKSALHEDLLPHEAGEIDSSVPLRVSTRDAMATSRSSRV